MLLDIVFQSGEFYGQTASSSWITQYGPLIAVASGFTLLFIQTWLGRWKERRQKKEEEKNSLTYFIALLGRVIKIVEKQLVSYEEHAVNINKEPFGRHLMQVYIAEDLNRIIRLLNDDKIFHAYIGKFGNGDQSILDFQNVVGQLDLIHAIYEQANTSQKNHLSDLIERLERYKDLSEEKVLNYSAGLANFIKQNDPEKAKSDPIYALLNESVGDYHKNAPKPLTIEYLQICFINPLKEKLVEKFRNNIEGMEIANNCRKATWLYNETISKSKVSSEEFKSHCNTFKDALETLKKGHSILLKPIGPSN